MTAILSRRILGAVGRFSDGGWRGSNIEIALLNLLSFENSKGAKHLLNTFDLPVSRFDSLPEASGNQGFFLVYTVLYFSGDSFIHSIQLGSSFGSNGSTRTSKPISSYVSTAPESLGSSNVVRLTHP